MPDAVPGPAVEAAVLRQAAAMVFVASLDVPVLDPADAHHLGRVLRLRAGEQVVAGDGAGGWRSCRWVPQGGLEPVGEVRRDQAPLPTVSIGFVPTKGDRPEWTVQKLTELGVDRIVVASSARGVVRWDGDRAGRHLDKLREVARQAAMQSRRTWLPIVEGIAPFADCCDGSWALATPGGAPPTLSLPSILVGPEGGWAPEEEGAGLPTIGLGPTVLRAETASVTAGALLAALRAGVVGPSVPPA